MTTATPIDITSRIAFKRADEEDHLRTWRIAAAKNAIEALEAVAKVDRELADLHARGGFFGPPTSMQQVVDLIAALQHDTRTL